jgi:protein-S-isoprenylcysteine O-methyltransferase Ste14
VFGGFGILLADSPLQLRFMGDSWLQIAGMAVTAFGYALFLWSVLARGRYATSWEMPEDQRLVTWGPYRYVRHPSYLAYFILFAGLLLLLLNLITLLPFIAIPGYVLITAAEEEMLSKKFGEAYKEYLRVTGRFFPKKRKD